MVSGFTLLAKIRTM